MTRAFRDGVENKRKVRAPVRMRTWNPIRDLRGLKARTTVTGNQMGPLVDVPAMVRIENEKWIFERISQETLTHLTHRLIVHEVEGPRTLGATLDLETAMQVAQGMARTDGSVVLIEPLR